MKNRSKLALLLAGAMALSLCGTPVLAAQEAAPAQAADQPADPAGTLSYANLEQRVRTGSLNYLYLEETVASIESVDYDQLREDMKDGLNQLADAQWSLAQAGSALGTVGALATSTTSQSLQSSYDALREQFDDLKEGKLQKTAADGVRQLRNAQNTIVLLAESTYIQLDALAAGQETLARSLAALDRQLEELELRYELGQISALSLQQARAGRTSLVSSQQTMASSAATGLMNLEALIGAELTGTLTLGALPQVTEEQLAALDLEADLAAAREASYDLYAAKKTLDEAEEDYKDAGKQYGYSDRNYEFVQARHTWQAAQYTYQGAVQSFELSFRSLYAQVWNSKQVLDAAQVALALEEDNYAVDQLKYEQGTISKNALLTARDDLAAAQDTVDTARRDLFSVYNNYRWAVEHGILT